MKTEEFMKAIKIVLPVLTIYYPETLQIELYFRINNKNVVFLYDEEYINSHDFEDIMARIDDDMFSYSNRVNKGEKQ